MSNQKKQGHDKNYWALALEGASFMGGISVMATSGSVALFINALTGSKALVGLAVTIQALFQLSGQLFVAPHTRSIRNLPGFLTKTILFQRIIPVLISIPLFLHFPSNWTITIFFILFIVFWILDGIVMLPWSEFVARALKPELRGQMMGLQITFGGIVSLATGLLLTWLLATPVLNDDYRYAMVFVLAGVVFLCSGIFLPMFKDPRPITAPEKQQMGQYYKRVPHVVKSNKVLQNVLFARIPAYVAFSAATFIVVFGASTLNLSDSQISWLVYASILGNLVGGVLLGEISKRVGSKAIIMLCDIGVLIALTMAISLVIFPSLGYLWLFITCALANMMQSNWLGYHTYFIDIAPERERSVFQVVGNCIGIPFSFVGYALGAVIDRWGFVVAFTIGIIAAVSAALLCLRLLSKEKVRELIEQREQ